MGAMVLVFDRPSSWLWDFSRAILNVVFSVQGEFTEMSGYGGEKGQNRNMILALNIWEVCLVYKRKGAGDLHVTVSKFELKCAERKLGNN